MAEAHRTPFGHDPSRVPPGLLEELAATSPAELRLDEVARARQHAEARAFDDGAVVEEIASQLLLFSTR